MVEATRSTLGSGPSLDLPPDAIHRGKSGRLPEGSTPTVRFMDLQSRRRAHQRTRPDIRVGDSAHRSRRIRRRDIELFARITGDRNPIHFDAALAARSRFGGLVVQGGITSGLLNALVAQDLPGPGSVFLHTNLNFRAPVRPGDVITAEAEVTEVRTDKPICTLRARIRNQNETVVLDGTMIVWRDPAVAYTGKAAKRPRETPIASIGSKVEGVRRHRMTGQPIPATSWT